MPWFLPSISNWAKHAHHLACTAELVIQYFCATVEGVLMMNSSASLSNVAVVSISTALLPASNSTQMALSTVSYTCYCGGCVNEVNKQLIYHCAEVQRWDVKQALLHCLRKLAALHNTACSKQAKPTAPPTAKHTPTCAASKCNTATLMEGNTIKEQ